jgi:septum formation inhibitor MinC
MKTDMMTRSREEILAYVAMIRSTINEVFSIDLSDYEWNLSSVDDALANEFSNVYANMKTSRMIVDIVKLCDNLVQYKKEIESKNQRFIAVMPGVEFAPFPFTRLNLKLLVIYDKLECDLLSIVLQKAYMFSRSVYDEIQTPDIDVDRFVEILYESLKKIEKQPELSRCRAAFNKIRESVGLLKSQFNDYYRDFVKTGDSTIIFQHFIIDVSKTTTAEPTIALQFREIIKYYQNLSKNQPNMSPQAKQMMERLNRTINSLGTKNLGKERTGAHQSTKDENTTVLTDIPSDSEIAVNTINTANTINAINTNDTTKITNSMTLEQLLSDDTF